MYQVQNINKRHGCSQGMKFTNEFLQHVNPKFPQIQGKTGQASTDNSVTGYKIHRNHLVGLEVPMPQILDYSENFQW